MNYPAADSKPILSVKNLVVNFPTPAGVVKAVDDVSFDLKPGQILGIVGESGSGKSVTSRSIMRMVHFPGNIDGGSIEMKGRNLLDISEEEMQKVRGNEIAMIFQDPQAALNPMMRIGAQIDEALMIHGKNQKEARARTLELLAQVGIPNPDDSAERYPHQFSGGMRQRVVIAIALANNPSVLIADEPTTALDVTIQAQILDLIRRLRDELGIAILFITHDMGVVAELCDDVLVMYHGKAVELGPVEEILLRPQDPYTISLLNAVPRMDSPLRPAPPAAPAPTLVVKDLKTNVNIGQSGLFKKHAPFFAVNGVSLSVSRGETVGLVGESGCGKSTLSRTIVGINKPHAGMIQVHGKDVTAMHAEDRKNTARAIQYVFQDPFSSLNPRRTAGQSLEEALQIAGVPREQVRERSAELMERVGLGRQFLDRYPHAFSGGQRQRVGIARALAAEPELLILDEPVSALDVSVQAQILELLERLQDELGLGYLFISHDLSVVRDISHRVAVMYKGQLVEEGTAAEVFDSPQHPYTIKLLSSTPSLQPKALRE